jgi:hypothetical protein
MNRRIRAPRTSRHRTGRATLLSVIAVAVGLASSARAQSLDRDGLLTEAPATPEAGTVRITGEGGGQLQSNSAESQGFISGTILWAAFHHFAADVSAYYQTGTYGPSVRARYQILTQDGQAIDLALGVRWKGVGFFQEAGELEMLVALGRSFGQLDTVLNLVWGFELDGPGMDAEVKALVGWRFSDAWRLGVDVRFQAEVHNENGWTGVTASTYDLIAGPEVSWMILPKLQLQALAGVAKPQGITTAGFTALLSLAFDF